MRHGRDARGDGRRHRGGWPRAGRPVDAGAGGDRLSVYNHEGPFAVSVGAGKYVLHETWGFGTTHPAFHCRGASAEFAPQPSYFPGPASYWFEHWQPFNGTATKDFGFQV